MDNDQLIKIGIQKRNKEINLSWQEIADKYTLGVKNGEQVRDLVRRALRKEMLKKPVETCSHKIEEGNQVESKKVQPEPTNEFDLLDLKEIELKKERIKLQDQKTKLIELIRKQARYEKLIEEFTTAMETCALREFKYIPHDINCNNKSLVVCFSDFHYGYKFESTFNNYSTDIFKDRFNNYLSRVIDIGKQHNIGVIYVLGLGDFVSGEIHKNLSSQNSIDVIRQTQEVSEHIAEGLYELSKEFNIVHFYSVIGNHGRVNPIKDDNVYTNNFEKIIPWYVKSRLANVKNVTIHDNTIDDGIGLIHVNNQKICFTHGDMDGNITNMPSSLSLTVGSLVTDIFIGHKHHFEANVVNGVNIVMSGSICGTDEYAKSIRRTGNACQTVALYNNSGLECLYNINLS